MAAWLLALTHALRQGKWIWFSYLTYYYCLLQINRLNCGKV